MLGVSAERDYTVLAHQLAKDCVIILKVIISHAPHLPKGSHCVEGLIRLAKALNNYFREKRLYDVALEQFAATSSEPVSMSAVGAPSATEWIIEFAWSFLCVINDHSNINLFNLEGSTAETEKALNDAWPSIRRFFVNHKLKKGAHPTGTFLSFSEDGTPIYVKRVIPSILELSDKLNQSEWELAHLKGNQSNQSASKDGPWSEPRSPSELSKLFKVHWTTLRKRLRLGTIRHQKISSKSYRIHLDDLPAATK